MTNRELLNMPRPLLDEADKQRLFLLRVQGTPMPCPACKRPVHAFDAAGITVDAYDFGKTRHAYRCPACGARLEQVVPPFSIGPFWHWRLEGGWLREQLEKAKGAEGQDRRERGEDRA
jgi:hypothetical protein